MMVYLQTSIFFKQSSPTAALIASGSLYASFGWLVLRSFAEALTQKCEASWWLPPERAVSLIWPPPAPWSWASAGFFALGLGLGRIWLQGTRQVCVFIKQVWRHTLRLENTIIQELVPSYLLIAKKLASGPTWTLRWFMVLMMMCVLTGACFDQGRCCMVNFPWVYCWVFPHVTPTTRERTDSHAMARASHGSLHYC